MVDLKLIERYGCTEERLKQVFTSKRPADYLDRPEEEQKQIDRDVATRERFETIIEDRQSESITRNLSQHLPLSAVDLAWDGPLTNRATLPLTLYAQGKFDMGRCAESLAAAGLSDKYVTKDKRGKPTAINLPKFYETSVNLVRSILTRRLAAQSNKYANLWPHFLYVPRGTSVISKLRADILGQRIDIIADQFGYKHHEAQVMRDMLLYGHCVDFVRCGWEKEQQERYKPQKPGTETTIRESHIVTTKEGIAFVNPHPSRVFWDNAHPLSSLNDDTGCEWVGFWDVARYKDVNLNTQYWNRDGMSFSSNVISLFSTYSNYFTQYYCTINPPALCQNVTDMSSGNDRKNNIGLYSGQQPDTSVIVANHYMKVIPKDQGLGDYQYPVWLRLVSGGINTILYAEWLPSTPGAVCSYNENDNRQVNMSFAQELMGYQDQLTNLLSYLLLCLQADHIKVVIVDKDLAEPEHIKAFREQLKGTTAWTGTTVLEISRKKLEDLGISDPKNIIQLVETKDSQLDVIFRAIGQLLQMVERMAALSPQEQGQPAPREISATETNLIAGTTESVYGFISDAIDEYRAAKKRIVYESYMVLGDPDFEVSVVNRYPRNVIEAAGFKVGEPEDFTVDTARVSDKSRPQRYSIIGHKELLEHDYIFTSRDGAERPVNTQSAAVLVQLLQSVLAMPQILAKIKPEQLFEIVNEIFRQSGAGYDLKLELQPGDENDMGVDPEAMVNELKGILDQMAKAIEKNTQDIAAITQAIEPILRMMPQAQGQPAPATAPMPMPMPMAA